MSLAPTRVGILSTVPSFTLDISASPTASPTNLAVIESGASKQTVLKGLVIHTIGTQTTTGIRNLAFKRVSTANTGTATVPTSNDSTDTFSGIARVGPSAVGTIGLSAGFKVLFLVPTALTAAPPIVYDFTVRGTLKGLVIPVGTLNSILIQDSGAAGAANLNISLIFTEG